MKKIGLEATRANKQYKTGTEWYAWHLLQGFKKLDHNNKFYIYYNQYLSGELKEAPDNFLPTQLNWPFKKFWTHVRLGWELLRRPVDKFFATNAVPIFTRGELTVTIHDLGFFHNPELYHPLERVYQKISHWLAINKAHKIIAISEETKKDIIKYFPRAKNKIRVVHLGHDSTNFKPLTKDEKQSFIDKHDYPDNYLLYIGRLETKKNVQALIKAYKKTSRKWPLILAGRMGNYGYQEIEELASDSDMKGDIILLGYVAQQNYPKLMASASAFVFPTKFEGFGMPLLEAMSCRVPIVCSNLPILKEVAENSALYFNPEDINDMAVKIEEMMNNSDLREDLVDKGTIRVQNFSWDKCAKQTLDYILE